MKSIKILLYLCTVIIVLNSGCATFKSGRHQNIEVNAMPRETYVYVDGAKYRTPCIINLKRSGSHKLVFEREGYIPTEFTLKKTMNGWTIGNLLLLPLGAYGIAGSVAGFIFDFATGSIYKLKPEQVEVIMRKDKGDQEISKISYRAEDLVVIIRFP